MKTWHGDYLFVLQNLIAKDFRVRYRNMSLGIFWSLLNPLIMMAVLTFVFTMIYPNSRELQYPVFVLCGLIPFNFIALSWGIGTGCIVDNTGLIKRTTFPNHYKNVYQFNPVAAIVLALRYILLENTPPAHSLLIKLALSSTFVLIIGWLVFNRAKRRFYDYL